MIKVNEKQSENNAITLISLVITIIVLIILASVVIYFGLNNNGIFNKAKEAKELTNKETATEKINLKIITAQMNKYADKQVMPTLKEISEVLREDNEIAYVTEKSQIASKKYEVGENPSSIFTKLKEYPYEFEINSSLQLASINGENVVNNDQAVTANELLIEPIIINSSGLIDKDYKIKSVEGYKYILFEVGYYWSNNYSKPVMSTSTLWAVEDIIYKDEVIKYLNVSIGSSYIYVDTNFIDSTTIHFGSANSNGTSADKFKIFSIKGIK